MKRAIFPDTKLLQPIPTPNGVHANISGNINNTTTNLVTPSDEPINTPITQTTPPIIQPSEVKNGDFYVIFYFLGFIVIFLIIIFVYEKLKSK